MPLWEARRPVMLDLAVYIVTTGQLRVNNVGNLKELELNGVGKKLRALY